MGKSRVNHVKNPVGWSSEFERIFVLGSARIRGEEISKRRPAGRFQASGLTRR